MKKFMSTPMATVVLFALAVLLLGFGGVNAIQASPFIESSDYRAQVQLSDINVAIVENYNDPKGEGKLLKNDDELLTDLKSSLKNSNESFQVGKKYFDYISVRNTQRPDVTKEGEGIPEFVRVSVYRYWTDSEGKAVTLDPDFIQIDFLDKDKNPDSKWFIDTEASTKERTVLYYKEELGVDDKTDPFMDGFYIKNDVAKEIANGTYKYDKDSGVSFHIKVTADAVQTHNGPEAMKSSWGRTNSEN